MLGSAGTVRANRAFVGDEDFLVCYADNLTDANLSALQSVHTAHDVPLTMGLFETGRPEECGIAALDPGGRITAFTEKPEKPVSNLANAGIYVASADLFDVIPEDRTPVDFGFDVIPKLVGRMAGCRIEGFLMDIGTPERYAEAQRRWPY